MSGPLVACVGMGMAMAPAEVVLMPPYSTPTPGPNTAQLAHGQGCSTFLINISPALREGDKILMTTNPIPGVGAITGTMMGAAEILTGWPKLLIKGRRAAYLGCTTGHNGPDGVFNMPAGTLVSVVQQ